MQVLTHLDGVHQLLLSGLHLGAEASGRGLAAGDRVERRFGAVHHLEEGAGVERGTGAAHVAPLCRVP
jgi:hypothetical protein